MRDTEFTEILAERRHKQSKLVLLSVNVVVCALMLIFNFAILPTIEAKAEEVGKETAKVIQVGTSGGVPAIQASVQNALNAGTYSLVITNPKTNTTFSQELNSSGKSVTFAITNFTENGTYPYTLQVNGLELLKGGVNLVSTKRTPAFTAQLSGTDLTLDITGGVDYTGQTIFFKSGTYSNSLVLSGDAIQRAFADAKGLNTKMTFSTEKGDLVTVDITKVGDKDKTPVTSTPKPSTGGNAGSVTTPPNSNNNGQGDKGSGSGGNAAGTITTPNITPKPSAGGSTQGSAMAKNITISLNQKTFKLEETLVATVNIVNTEYAGRAITVRLGADDNSTVALLDLDNNGKGSSTFKILIPQPSSKVITATAYSISGTQLDSNSVNYSISNEVGGGSGTKEDGEMSADVPSAKYVSLDLSALDTQKAVLAWYEGRNLSKYTTKLKVVNTTTGDEHSYAVFMPDGDSKIDMNLVYDGPGIYTWELHSGGKLVAQAPYSTPLGIDGATAVSQNGLPVLKTLANKSVYLTNLEGIDPNGVSGATIGEPIGGVPADDITGQTIEEPFNAEVEQINKKRNMVIGLAAFMLVLLIVVFILYRRKHKREDQEEESNGFVAYKDDEEDETISGDTSKFEEVD